MLGHCSVMFVGCILNPSRPLSSSGLLSPFQHTLRTKHSLVWFHSFAVWNTCSSSLFKSVLVGILLSIFEFRQACYRLSLFTDVQIFVASFLHWARFYIYYVSKVDESRRGIWFISTWYNAMQHKFDFEKINR